MKRTFKFQHTEPSLTVALDCPTVGEIIQRYLSEGSIPHVDNSRPYAYETRDDFDGNFEVNRHPDLISMVSRESREAVAKKAAVSSSPSNPTPAPSDSQPSNASVSEPPTE